MTMDRNQRSENAEAAGRGGAAVAIECLKGSSNADEWNGNLLQTGDIVEELKIGSYMCVRSPFKNGKSGVQRLLHDSFKKKVTSIQVRVRRGTDEFIELQACIVPNESAGRKQYMLRSIGDPNYAVGFADRTEIECLELQGSRSSRVMYALNRAQLQDGYVSYPWEKRMQEVLPVHNSSCFLSLLLLPKASDRVSSRYNDLEDTLSRANAWLNASQATGVPIVFMNIQTESLLTKISGETASSTVNAGSLSDLSNLANVSLYGFEDYHGVDIGVVRAVRLWYAPIGGEFALEIQLREGDTKLGFAISRTEEGFIYISSVMDGEEDVASTRSGLRDLYKEATRACKLLVVSRVSNQKVLPWMVSSTGAIRCYDTVSLSQKLSLHRHALRPILIHVLMWDRALASQSGGIARFRANPVPVMPLPAEIQLPRPSNDSQILPLPPEVPLPQSPRIGEGPEPRFERDTAGELSFRFHDFSLSSSWV
ncbi:PREDICTED: uncharacterized protein LOC104603460 [Nelumbo nucifera]|uniref:Uncharacterized protein LOC104603460 n=1 Tax=Nelumbo nucifera TaxID=4432 RepID=A0A1U8AIT4_NELNU|nr:PREDICTED: uncharacterized protein LOC104603460 [Nelumbo nucifera]XP_010265796.1 PREDICTED: uncharacterized protein LOC104603460 [Nelumbo nucifera]